MQHPLSPPIKIRFSTTTTNLSSATVVKFASPNYNYNYNCAYEIHKITAETIGNEEEANTTNAVANSDGPDVDAARLFA